MTQPPEPPSGSGAPGWHQAPDVAGEPAPAPPAGWPAPPVPGDWSAPGWAPPRRNGPALASLVLGVLAIPAVIFLAPGILFGIAALALGLIGRGRVKRGEATAKGAATAGAVLGTLAVVLTVAWGVALYVLDERNQDAYEECLRTGEVPSVCVDRFDPTEP